MDDRFNTFAGWALFAGIVALGGGIVFGKMFHSERPEHMGYVIEGVEAEGEGGSEGPSLNELLANADIAKGEKVFAKCVACHTINDGGANGIGPNLHGIVGEGVGTGHGGFPFSDALKGKGGSWDFATLDVWLKSPREFAPGTKMTFAGLGKPEDRANVIAYLNSQGSNLPLPEAGAPAAAGEEGGEAGNASEPAEGEGGAEAAAVVQQADVTAG
ncbi:MAG: cytochrome c family protein [Sphingomonadales bacterium]|nr:MAG: cytochrome c family protein [Sphingomonadales bacterium]